VAAYIARESLHILITQGKMRYLYTTNLNKTELQKIMTPHPHATPAFRVAPLPALANPKRKKCLSTAKKIAPHGPKLAGGSG
jgi:hypothetical protein